MASLIPSKFSTDTRTYYLDNPQAKVGSGTASSSSTTHSISFYPPMRLKHCFFFNPRHSMSLYSLSHFCLPFLLLSFMRKHLSKPVKLCDSVYSSEITKHVCLIKCFENICSLHLLYIYYYIYLLGIGA